MERFTISLKVGEFTVKADGPIVSEGRTNPDGTPDTTPADVEHDFMELFYLENMRVEDSEGSVITPIIKRIAYVNSGYVFTFSDTFWREGFVIDNGSVVFLSYGKDTGYHGKEPVVRDLKGGAGECCSREELEAFLEPRGEVVDWERVKLLRISHFGDYDHNIRTFQTEGKVGWLQNEDDLRWDGDVLHVKAKEEIFL